MYEEREIELFFYEQGKQKKSENLNKFKFDIDKLEAHNNFTRRMMM